jgi:hypothetical protein
MTRRFFSSRLLLGALALGSTGCETLHSMLRSHKNDDEMARKSDDDDVKPRSVESDTSKIPSVDSDDKNQKPFFPNSGRAGGWSKQAQEIEKNLGYY